MIGFKDSSIFVAGLSLARGFSHFSSDIRASRSFFGSTLPGFTGDAGFRFASGLAFLRSASSAEWALGGFGSATGAVL